MARAGRVVSQSGIYHVLLRAQELFFHDELDYQVFLNTLGEYFHSHKAALLGYALLPAKVHLVVYTNGDTLSAVMKPFCTSYARTYNRLHQKSGKLFYDRYKSVPVAEGGALADTLAFVHTVPERLDLAQTYSSRTEYTTAPVLCNTTLAAQLAGGLQKIIHGDANNIGMEDYLHMPDTELERYVKAFCGYDFSALSELDESKQTQVLDSMRGHKWFSVSRIAARIGMKKPSAPKKETGPEPQQTELSFWLL